MYKKLLVTTPFLNNIGGTEIEAVLTAIHFYDTNQFRKVTIFSPRKTGSLLFKEIVKQRKIQFLHYPAFFNFKTIIFLNTILKKFGLKTPFLESFFWFFVSLRFSNFFVLTYPGCIYFFPLFKFYNKNKKYVAKITMWHFKQLSEEHHAVYDKFTKILVFNDEQRLFWKLKNLLKKVVPLDIMILNEDKLLGLTQRTFEQDLVFGYLGRISREKNLDEMILLIDFLNNKNKKKTKLIIQGSGDPAYLQELEALVLKYNLYNFVTFNKEFISPLQTHTFYQEIDVFLVTSKIEGGPMTSLEAVAAGCYVMGYNIGAMQDRFQQFPYVVNQSFYSLRNSALYFLNLTTFEKNIALNELRKFYVSKLSNTTKGFKLNQLFD
jgi:glycosyltransferase involved in cell wall biosynthesis